MFRRPRVDRIGSAGDYVRDDEQTKDNCGEQGGKIEAAAGHGGFHEL
jgi:hypothetical protein